MVKRLFGPGNLRTRLLVGLLLVALICIHGAGTASDSDVRAIAVTVDHSETPDQIAAKARQLAAKDHLSLLEYCVRNYTDKHRDYTCTLVKQERLGGVIGKEQELSVKFKELPFSVAMAWTRNAPQGDRVLYIEGKYENNMLVRYLPQKDAYPAYKTVVYIDQEYLVPILIEGFGWRNQEFLCRYWYRDVKLNSGLKDADFAPEVNDLVSPTK